MVVSITVLCTRIVSFFAFSLNCQWKMKLSVKNVIDSENYQPCTLTIDFPTTHISNIYDITGIWTIAVLLTMMLFGFEFKLKSFFLSPELTQPAGLMDLYQDCPKTEVFVWTSESYVFGHPTFDHSRRTFFSSYNWRIVQRKVCVNSDHHNVLSECQNKRSRKMVTLWNT